MSDHRDSDTAKTEKFSLYSLFSSFMSISSFHLSNPREIVPRISDKLYKS